MKRIVVLLLAIMMCFIGIACGNDAEKTDKDKATPSATVVETQKPTATPIPTPVFSEGLKYRLNSSETGYIVEGIGSCNDETVILPDTYQNLPVTTIDKSAVSCQTSFKTFIIPDSVTSIGECAFDRCTNLESVTIPNNVTAISCSIMRRWRRAS